MLGNRTKDKTLGRIVETQKAAFTKTALIICFFILKFWTLFLCLTPEAGSFKTYTIIIYQKALPSIVVILKVALTK